MDILRRVSHIFIIFVLKCADSLFGDEYPMAHTLIFTEMKKFIYAIALLGMSSVASAQSFEEHLEAGRQAFMDYDFSEASRQYSLARKKAKKADTSLLQEYESDLTIAHNFLDRVEKLEIIDSISVPKKDFFKAYRLPSSAGHLDDAKSLPFRIGDVGYVFSNESRDFKMWAQPDSTGNLRLVESSRLVDGSWSEPAMADEELNGGGNAEYPFMLSDGVTLYFANDGEESLGGLDIFVATRDAATGEYLQPQNIGMPYNSPYDDYMLAIDEENGVGWWATDRNQLDDMVTIYVYKLNDLRQNYDPDDDRIAELAFVSDISETRDPESDYSKLLATIRNIRPEVEKKADFHFPMPGGKIYTVLDDFQSASARTMMRKYLQAKQKLDDDMATLSRLRREYAKGKGGSLTTQIKRLETDVETGRKSVDHLRSEVYRAAGN